MGASTTATDSTHGNTPLHWAVTGRNQHAIGLLSEKPNVDFHAVNLNGETPIDIFQAQVTLTSQQNKKKLEEAENEGKPPPPLQQFFVPKKIRERFEDEFSKTIKHAPKSSSSRHTNSAYRFSSCLTKAVSGFFKDKKVAGKLNKFEIFISSFVFIH